MQRVEEVSHVSRVQNETQREGGSERGGREGEG